MWPNRTETTSHYSCCQSSDLHRSTIQSQSSLQVEIRWTNHKKLEAEERKCCPCTILPCQTVPVGLFNVFYLKFCLKCCVIIYKGHSKTFPQHRIFECWILLFDIWNFTIKVSLQKNIHLAMYCGFINDFCWHQYCKFDKKYSFVNMYFLGKLPPFFFYFY